jgi:hypothetical protein
LVVSRASFNDSGGKTVGNHFASSALRKKRAKKNPANFEPGLPVQTSSLQVK